MDITPFLDLRIAPRAVFDALAERQTRVRFMVPDAAKPGEWRAVTWGTFAAEIRELALFLGTVLKSGDRGAIYAPNRVEWASAALAIQAAGGVMVPIYPASTADQVGYVASHSDAKVLFVDTPALLSRLFTTWSSLGAVERIVLLDDGLDAARVHEALRAKGVSVPPFEEVDARLISISRAPMS